MEESKNTNVPSIYVSDLEKLASKIRQVTGEENVEVGFEFIIASLFPTSWQNIQEALSQQYTQGYMQGYKDAEVERKSIQIIDNNSDCYCE